MADFAGACAAIEERLAANWTTTPIAYENQAEPDKVIAGELVPWVYLEIETDSAAIQGIGTPGSHVVKETGAVVVTVYVPQNYGRSLARTYAGQIGEIFRAAKFYDDGAGNYVRTWTPKVGGMLPARSENPDGPWWAVAVTIPFEFWRRA